MTCGMRSRLFTVDTVTTASPGGGSGGKPCGAMYDQDILRGGSPREARQDS